MKKKIILGTIITVLLVLLIPVPIKLKDGGTVEYKSLTYKISKVHKLNSNSKTGYEEGVIVEIFGIKVYDSVELEPSNIPKDDNGKDRN